MTYEELHAEMVAAMKAKDKVRLGVARLVLGELKNAASRGGAHEITEEEVTAQIKRTLKQTNETLEMSEKAGNNAERTENLREQVAVLESLLPQQVSGDELVALVEKTIAERRPAIMPSAPRTCASRWRCSRACFRSRFPAMSSWHWSRRRSPSWVPRPRRTWARGTGREDDRRAGCHVQEGHGPRDGRSHCRDERQL